MADPCQCFCHTSSYAACSISGGCGSVGCGRTDQRSCNAGAGCKAYDPVAQRPADTPDPLCWDCLAVAERDVRNLVYDYLDLAQLHEASMSQAVNEKTAGSKESPLLLAAHVEALQAEIVHVLTAWEGEVRSRANLSDPPDRARAGAHVQRAVTILAPRLRQLSLIKPTSMYRTGCEDDTEEVAGWEAVHHLQDLHRRSRGVLGRTKRILSLHGACPNEACEAEALYRTEPGHFEDEPPVWCDACKAVRPYGDYEHFMIHLVWPAQPAPAAT